MKFPLLLALTILNSCNCFANSNQQDTTIIIADGKLIKGNRLTGYHQSIISYSVTNEQETKTGTVDDTYQLVTIDGKKYGLRVAKIILPGREILDSGLVDAETLKPVYHRSHQTTKTMLFEFAGKTVKGTIEANQKMDTVAMNFSDVLFDSYYETLIARTIELKDGFLFKYPDFIYEEGGQVWQSGKIEKDKDGWIITYTDSKSGRKTTYWIDDKRNFKQVQYQFGDRISRQRPA